MRLAFLSQGLLRSRIWFFGREKCAEAGQKTKFPGASEAAVSQLPCY
jgi:hypothetical protein